MNFDRRARGMALLAVMIVLVASTVAATMSIHLLKVQRQREQERELLRLGQRFSDALAAYAAATPGGGRELPRTLNDLLEDPRYPTARRHLRRIEADPLTHRFEWGVVRNNDRIEGIYSLSERQPFKRANFPENLASFSNARRYSDWKFTVAAASAAPAAPAPPTPAPGALPPPTPSPSQVD